MTSSFVNTATFASPPQTKNIDILSEEIKKTILELHQLETEYNSKSKKDILICGIALKLIYDYTKTYLQDLLSLKYGRMYQRHQLSYPFEMSIKVSGDVETLNASINSIIMTRYRVVKDLEKLEKDPVLTTDNRVLFFKKRNKNRFLTASWMHIHGLKILSQKLATSSMGTWNPL